MITSLWTCYLEDFKTQDNYMENKLENCPSVQELYHLITNFLSLPPQNNDNTDVMMIGWYW